MFKRTLTVAHLLKLNIRSKDFNIYGEITEVLEKGTVNEFSGNNYFYCLINRYNTSSIGIVKRS